MLIDRARLLTLLDEGEMLARVDAEAILADREEHLADLLMVLQQKQAPRAWTAGVLLSAMDDPRAVPVFVEVLHDLWLGELAQEGLARIGEPALEALLPRADDSLTNHALAEMGMRHPHLVPRIAEACLRVVRTCPDPQMRALAAWSLLDLDWRAAEPDIEALVRTPGWDDDHLDPSETQMWAKERPPETDPLRRLAPQHRIELHRYLLDLQEAIDAQMGTPEFRARFEREVEELRPRGTAVRRQQVGRNDPCPCGSGKKYKKCCSDADQSLGQPGPLEARMQGVAWAPSGYLLSPREQLAQLDEREVFEHLDILRLPGPTEVRRRLEGETRDYMLWAGAARMACLGHGEAARQIALTVALSEQGHPALNYHEIGSLSQAGVSARRSSRAVFELYLNRGFLADALNYAQEEWKLSPEEGLRSFELILARHPQPLWTYAALADAARYHESNRAIPFLEKALTLPSKGYHLLPDRPCPRWVLEAYLEALREDQRTSQRIRMSVREWDRHPLSPPQQRQLIVLSRREEEDPVPFLREVLGQHLPGRRQLVLTSRNGDLLVWITGTPSSHAPVTRAWDVLEAQDDPCRAALLSVAGEAGLSQLHITEGGWGGWRALSVTVSDDEFAELAGLAVDESLGVVPIEWRLATALGGEEFLAAPAVPAAVAQEPTLEDYLRRILTRLLRQNKVGAAHTDLGNFFSGVPGQFRGALKQLLELMVADGYVRLKPTLTGTHISLEPRRLSSVKQFLEGGELPPGRLVEYFT